jgi:hypothetical protein
MMIKDRRRDRVDWTVVQWCVGQPVLTGEVVGGAKGNTSEQIALWMRFFVLFHLF